MSTITLLPEPPSRADPTNFPARADDFLGALPTFAIETNTVASEVNENALTASTAASTATAQANAATAIVNAVKWVSGATYATDAAVWSPVDQATYRRKSPGGSSTIDPSIDPTRWDRVTPVSVPQFILMQQGII